MDHYTSMLNAIAPIKLYKVNQGRFIKNELKAYASGFDELESRIEEILKECFVMTAEDNGLRFYENQTGLSREGLSIEKRRELVMSMISLNGNDNTLDGIKHFFKTFDLDCYIEENPSVFDLYIKPMGRECGNEERRLIVTRAKSFLPCHLTFTIDFRQSTWKDYDDAEKTFKQIDGMELTWEEFEMYDV